MWGTDAPAAAAHRPQPPPRQPAGAPLAPSGAPPFSLEPLPPALRFDAGANGRHNSRQTGAIGEKNPHGERLVRSDSALEYSSRLLPLTADRANAARSPYGR